MHQVKVLTAGTDFPEDLDLLGLKAAEGPLSTEWMRKGQAVQ